METTTTIHYPELDSAIIDSIPAEAQSATSPISGTEYRNAVACLYGISELSPRIAHQMMRKIIGVYRSLAAIAEIEN